MSTKRLFFGVRLPLEIHHILGEIQRLATQEDNENALRWVRPENFHVTLHFLGDTSEEIVPELIASFGATVARIPSSTVALDRAGAFPNQRRPRVVWVGLRDETGVLKRVYDALIPSLEHFELEIDTRPFHPHITVGYARKKAHPKTVARAFAGFVASARNVLAEQGPERIPVSQVELIQSDLGSAGPSYSTVAQAQLAPA